MSQEKKALTPDELLAGDDSTVRDRSIFWKGETVGAWIVGKIARFREHKFDGMETATPIAVIQSGAQTNAGRWEYVREAHVTLSAELRARIDTMKDRGRVVAIRFDGFADSGKESETRLYTVTEPSAERFAQVMASAEA